MVCKGREERVKAKDGNAEVVEADKSESKHEILRVKR